MLFKKKKKKKMISYDPLPLDQILFESLTKRDSKQFTFLWKVMIGISSPLDEKDMFSKWIASKLTTISSSSSSTERSLEVLSFFFKTNQQFTIKVTINLVSLTMVNNLDSLINQF